MNLLVSTALAAVLSVCASSGTPNGPDFATRHHAAPAVRDVDSNWGDGALVHVARFVQEEGVGGDEFDWRVPPGIFYLQTTQTTIFGGPGFDPVEARVVENGVIRVRNLEVPVGSTLRCLGPNPVTILASGRVDVEGTIDVSGLSHLGINDSLPADVPRRGAEGACGGGRGGASSPHSEEASAIGARGRGAFGLPQAGGSGGESGFRTNIGAGAIGAGGGGGVFARPQIDPCDPAFFDQNAIGLDAEFGFDGPVQNGAFGALDGTGRGNYDATGSQGGAPGRGPFVDGDPDNDFWGTLFDPASGARIQGELRTPWAGAGGGGGGDRVVCATLPCSFPPTPWNPFIDSEGGPGGGGGGALLVFARGDVRIAGDGQMLARGGHGGHGETIGNFAWRGGGGGGGSGGHVVVQSLGVLDLSQLGAGSAAVVATGGQGGAGRDNIGGANQFGERPFSEACPGSAPCGSTDCLGRSCPLPCIVAPGAGGDGGPGVIQFHVESPGDLLLPAWAGNGLYDVTRPTAVSPLLPLF